MRSLKYLLLVIFIPTCVLAQTPDPVQDKVNQEYQAYQIQQGHFFESVAKLMESRRQERIEAAAAAAVMEDRLKWVLDNWVPKTP